MIDERFCSRGRYVYHPDTFFLEAALGQEFPGIYDPSLCQQVALDEVASALQASGYQYTVSSILESLQEKFDLQSTGAGGVLS
jgi:hypothetical protein